MSDSSGATPLRFVAGRARVIGRRPLVLARGFAGRLGVGGAYTAWPNADTPLQLLPADDVGVAEWMRANFEPWAEHRLSHAAWNLLRGRSLVIARSPGLAERAAELALGRALDAPKLGCVSASGHAQSKFLCFVFEGGGAQPTLVVKGIPEPGEGPRLVAETRLVEEIRARVDGDPEVVAGMPLAPLWIGTVEADELVVEPVDPLAAATGEEDRGLALAWLDGFQRAGSTTTRAWGDDEERAQIDDVVSFAWAEAVPDRRADALAAVDRLAAPLRGIEVPVCPAHGDFWRGNIACAQGAIRVFDWEWATVAGRPFFDRWSYELGSLRHDDSHSVEDLAEGLRTACRRVEDGLDRAGLDRRFALATLARAVGEISFRVRRVRGQAPDNEQRALRLVAAADRLLAA